MTVAGLEPQVDLDTPCTQAGPRIGESRVAWRIEGLDCPDCARSVGSAVERVPGVRCVDLNFASATLLVDFDPSREPLEEIVETIAAAGYGAVPLGDSGHLPVARERSWVDRNTTEIATVGSGTLTLLGWLLALSGLPESVSITAYALAIAAGGLLVWRRAWLSLKARVLDMNVLMTVAVMGAALLGEWGEGATVYFLFALGGMLESRSLAKTRRSIRDLMTLTPATVRLRRGESLAEVPVEQAIVGEVFVVRPGERIALDGVVRKGFSAVDEAAITGESMPAEKSVGDSVFAGTLNQHGLVEVEATATSSDSTISRVVYLVEEAQASRAPAQTLVERFSRWYTPLMIAVAVLVGTVPPLLGPPLGFDVGPWTEWVRRALVVLVVSCPCALVISTPVSIVSGITRATRDGVLVKGGIFLEAASRVDAVAFDKTGTLTHGRPEVANVVALDGSSAEDLLEVAAALESHSNHPLARAIVRATPNAEDLEQPAEFTESAGVGVSGVLGGEKWELASPGRAQATGALASDGAEAAIKHAEESGQTALVLIRGGLAVGIIGVSDTLRPEAADVVRRLMASGIDHTVMLTGDNERVAEAVAAKTGVRSYLSRLLPEAKTEAVAALKKRYTTVAMVGDGVNDAPALAASDIGIAMGAAGTDTALETADVALMRDDLTALPGFFALGRRTMTTIKQNVAFSVIVKLLFLVLALSGTATLWMAVFADTGVSLLVILNGMRLLRRVA